MAVGENAFFPSLIYGNLFIYHILLNLLSIFRLIEHLPDKLIGIHNLSDCDCLIELYPKSREFFRESRKGWLGQGWRKERVGDSGN